LSDFDRKATRFEGGGQSEEASIAGHGPDKFVRALRGRFGPDTFIAAFPLTVLDAAQVLPGGYARAAIIKAIASAFDASKIFTAENYFHRVFLFINIQIIPVV
jgi:hypothetical protein